MTLDTGTSQTAEANRLQHLDHLLAGNAVITVTDGQERYTFQFNMPKQGNWKGKMLARLLTGPDNTSDFTFLGEVKDGKLVLSGRIGTGQEAVPTSAALARYLVHLAVNRLPTPSGIRVYGSGRCMRCRRELTATDNPYFPYLGPECGGK